MSLIGDKAQLFRFQENGDNLTGKLVDVYQTEFGGNAYDLVDGMGDRFYFFGSVQLNRLLSDRLDKIVSITYKGTQQTKKGRTMKVFEVSSWNSDEDDMPGNQAKTKNSLT